MPPWAKGGKGVCTGRTEMRGKMSVAVHGRTESEQTEPARDLLTSSRRLAIAEHLGFACEVCEGSAVPGIERMRTGSGRELLWTSAVEAAGGPVCVHIARAGARIPIFARVLGDPFAERVLAQQAGEWSPSVALVDGEERRLASIWTSRDGDVFLPFDPDEVCHNYWSESYVTLTRPAGSRRARRLAMRVYYRGRDLLPRPAQIWLRRLYALEQRRTPFPSWPAETALHDFFDLFTAILVELAGEPLPRLAAWPDGYSWALVLTHDVEHAAGLAAVEQLVALERRLGLRSSFNLVPRRYQVEDQAVRELIDAGFEVGVHGLYHDGRDLESRELLRERLPGMRAAAERWGAVGFRSPATHRNWELMPELGFDYDSSYPDTDPFEPQAGGCCTWLPYFNREMIELPLTMPQDHTMFVILRRDESLWMEKAELLRARGGMALIDTHPDYLIDQRIMRGYARLLERYAPDATAWKPLPAEVSAWWRDRAASRVTREGSGWIVTGPAAGRGRVELVEGAPWR